MLAVDWSGDAGLKIGGGSSDHLVVAVVSYDEAEITSVLDALRRQMRRDPSHEFHFVKEPERTREAFMTALIHANIEAVVVTVNKRGLPKPPRLPRGDDLVVDLICSSTMQLSRAAVENAVMVIDGGKDAKALCTQVRKSLSQRMRAEGFDYRIGKVRPYRSHRSDGVMVADMLSGAGRHTALGRSPDYLAPLRDKITRRAIP